MAGIIIKKFISLIRPSLEREGCERGKDDEKLKGERGGGGRERERTGRREQVRELAGERGMERRG